MTCFWPRFHRALPLCAALTMTAALLGCAEPLERRGARLSITADTWTSSPAEIDALLAQGEAFHAAIAAIVPPDLALDDVVDVKLHGDFGGTVPHVDGEGTVHLWRYPADQGGYSAIFAHELVHAIAFDAAVDADALDWPFLGFYIEGWAEYVAMRVHPSKTGFPFYGVDEDVVVGYWLEHARVSLDTLRHQHDALNARCQHEAYTLRASWFRYVDEVLGRDVALALSYTDDGFTPDVVERVLGASLAQVDADWRAWAAARYAAHPDAAKETARYASILGGYAPCTP